MTYIELDGVVETTLSHEDWLDAFIARLEARGEYFGGISTPVDEHGDPLHESKTTGGDGRGGPADGPYEAKWALDGAYEVQNRRLVCYNYRFRGSRAEAEGVAEVLNRLHHV